MAEKYNVFGGEEESILRQRAKEKKRAKVAERRKAADAKASLNVNSMMDMMTIILCFLLKSYGEEPINIHHKDLKVPPSTSMQAPEDMMTIVITKTSILIGDELVVRVDGGVIDPVNKGGNADSLVILPLKDKLQTEVDYLKLVAEKRRQKFEGKVTIISDEKTPYRLLTEVIFTAQQAELTKFKFAIGQTMGDREVILTGKAK